MKKYAIKLLPSWEKGFDALPKDVQGRVVRKVEALAEEPRGSGVKKLKGEPGYRARVGEYRIVYQVEDDVLLLVLVRVAHRKDVYR